MMFIYDPNANISRQRDWNLFKKRSESRYILLNKNRPIGYIPDLSTSDFKLNCLQANSVHCIAGWESVFVKDIDLTDYYRCSLSKVESRYRSILQNEVNQLLNCSCMPRMFDLKEATVCFTIK